MGSVVGTPQQRVERQAWASCAYTLYLPTQLLAGGKQGTVCGEQGMWLWKLPHLGRSTLH